MSSCRSILERFKMCIQSNPLSNRVAARDCESLLNEAKRADTSHLEDYKACKKALDIHKSMISTPDRRPVDNAQSSTKVGAYYDPISPSKATLNRFVNGEGIGGWGVNYGNGISYRHSAIGGQTGWTMDTGIQMGGGDTWKINLGK